MKIKHNLKESTILFNCVPRGGIFKHTGNFYIRLLADYNVDNVFNLTNSKFEWYASDSWGGSPTLVEYFPNATLYLEG